MKTKFSAFAPYIALIAASVVFSSCDYSEDPGPIQEIEKEFDVVDFDRLEIGDAMHIDVEQGNFFEISVRGDRRNVNDLEVYNEGSTLIVRFDESRNRRHETYVTITMPALIAANFSGASNSRVSGFSDVSSLDLILSGASVCQLDVNATEVDMSVSGASYLTARGSAQSLKANISGASVVKSFNFPVISADVRATGASSASVTVSETLHAVAEGASSIIYRGNPTVTSEVSGASTVHQD